MGRFLMLLTSLAVIGFTMVAAFEVSAQPYVKTVPVSVSSLPSSAAETIPCNSGTSPCTVGASATTVLNAQPGRRGCLIQNINTTDFYCKRATSGGSAASTVNMDFLLKAASAANKGDGGAYTCADSGSVWTGAINCTGSAGSGTLVVSGIL